MVFDLRKTDRFIPAIKGNWQYSKSDHNPNSSFIPLLNSAHYKRMTLDPATLNECTSDHNESKIGTTATI